MTPEQLARAIEEMAENPQGGRVAAIAYRKCARLIRKKLSGETPHPWAAFLAARADCIDLFHNEGKTDEAIARELTMDGARQVYLIRTRLRDPAPSDGGER